jgi:hypothetical protein
MGKGNIAGSAGAREGPGTHHVLIRSSLAPNWWTRHKGHTDTLHFWGRHAACRELGFADLQQMYSLSGPLVTLDVIMGGIFLTDVCECARGSHCRIHARLPPGCQLWQA